MINLHNIFFDNQYWVVLWNGKSKHGYQLERIERTISFYLNEKRMGIKSEYFVIGVFSDYKRAQSFRDNHNK